MFEVLALIGGLVGGALVGWLIATGRTRAAAVRELTELQTRVGAAESVADELRRQLGQRDAELAELRTQLQAAQQQRTAAEIRADESLRNLEQQRQLLAEAEQKLKDAFAALSVESLRRNSEEFARQAAEKVRPLGEALARYEAEIRRIEQERQKAYGGLAEQLKALATTHQQLSRETVSLTHALRAPQTKGRWGEITLRRAVEVAGLSPHCDFETQVSVETDGGRQRPDLVVRLPGGRSVVVDAKAPTSAYLDALAAEDEERRREHLLRHAQAIRSHMQALSTKAYWEQFGPTPEFVVMFVPGESFFSAALEQDRELIEDGFRKRVILASPTTLIALLRAVAYSWQQQELVDNARQISRTARDLFERLCKFGEHFAGLGRRLRQATEAYNDAVGSWERRLLPLGQRINELGVGSGQESFAELERVEAQPRDPPRAES